LHAAVERAAGLRSPRGEADEVADRILARLDGSDPCEK
jgi:hypothetical protein